MSDRLDAMALLLSVVDAGGLSAAARKQNIPLATVSRKIADLEARLGARLFQRSGRGLLLTEAGRTYVFACRRILEDVAEAERNASGEYVSPKGRLTITAPVVFGRLHVLPVVLEFLTCFAEIDVRLIQADRLLDLAEEQVDLAIRIGRLPDSNLHARSIGSMRQVVCASPAYLQARGEPSAPSELAAHDCIEFENLQPDAVWTFRAGDKQIAVPIRPRLAVNTAEAAIDAACGGLGLARVLSYQVRDLVADGALRIVLEGHEGDPWPVNIVYPARGLVTQKLRSFVDFAAPRLRARLEEVATRMPG